MWTYNDLQNKVRLDLDLEAEDFISAEEMLGYANEGIDRAAQEVHTLYEDYFISYESLDLVSGQEEYDLPANMYAHKIRRIIYNNGTKVYKIARIPDWHKFEEYSLDRITSADNYLSYFLLNSTPGFPKILMTPVPQETLAGKVKVWYIRRANKLLLPTDPNYITEDANILDIPEANNYILQYVKVRCLEKEQNPMLQKAMADLAEEMKLLVTTLAAMVPDADNNIEPDFSTYQEMS